MRLFLSHRLGVTLSLGAIGSSGTQSKPPNSHFAAELGGAPVACGQSFKLGTPPITATSTDLRFYP